MNNDPEFMKLYMRDVRAGVPKGQRVRLAGGDFTKSFPPRKVRRTRAGEDKAPGSRESGERSSIEHRRRAKFDPKRDGPVTWATPQAEFLGDPPRGRSALERQP